MRLVRIWFDKTGEAKYISHLDLMRCFTRAIRRARIPLWYTEGFNPHPYMQFSLPLSLGMQSVCESVDIRIEGDMSDEELLTALKEVMPVGIDVKKITSPKFDPKYIAYGDFYITFKDVPDKTKMLRILNDVFAADRLIVEKLGKKGRHKVMKEINLKEYIRHSYVKETETDVVVNLILPAGSTTNINPSLFSDKIVELYGENMAVDILINRLLLDNMKEFK
ncbi:MAG: TIGR03936 family radical SAM-associated protein [Clostridia bacterium]|nr:TIGR03936 family radical SAM-associated protein [Clostridia bacterium]